MSSSDLPKLLRTSVKPVHKYHRRRKYGRCSPNSLRPISYFGSIWELYVLDLKTKVFCRKENQLLFPIRWVSVVEFHDPTLIIGKVFGQESTVVKWNYQILGLHQVTVRQKLGVILVIKWFKNWSQQKMLFTKKVRLNWYSSMNFFLERFGWFLT